MMKQTWLLSLLMLFCLGMSVTAQEIEDGSSSLDTLDGLVAQWIALRTAIAEEKRDWNEQQEQWQREIQLLEQETALLDSEMADHAALMSDLEAEQSEMLSQRQVMTAELQEISNVLNRIDSTLAADINYVPAILQPHYEPVFSVKADRTSQPVTERAQTVVGLLTQMESLHNEIHVVRETLETGDGVRRQVDVCYIGLARAFAVSSDQQWAVIGVPVDGQWQWTPRQELASEIAQAVAIFHRQKTADFIRLPMQIVEEGQP